MQRAKDMKRVSVRVDDDMYQRIQYWSEKKGMSANDYLYEALELAIRHENKDYDLPTMEQARLNQLLDVIKVLSLNVESLESVVTSGFDSLLGLVRGDNYLMDDEDGEL